jgi:tetratricopeptide (TPR) repeat protein
MSSRKSASNVWWCRRGVFCLALLALCFSPSWLARAQDSPATARVPTVREAAATLEAGDLARADSELHAILQASPADVHALNLLAIVRVQQKRNAEAEALFKQAMTIQPDFAGPYSGLGLLYAQTGKNDLAIPALQESLRLDPGRKDAEAVLISIWRTQAHDAAEHNDSEKALALLIEARKLNPADADVQYEFGMVALRMSLFADSIAAFKQALNLRPDDAPALYGLGRAEMSVSRFDEAQQTFARYVQLRPADASGHYALGFTLRALQKSPDARAEFENSIALQPLQTESYFQLGLIELEAGNSGAAAQKFGQVLKRAPQHAGALTGMGRVKFQEKQYAEAVPLFEKAIAANSRLREAHYYLGLADARLGRKEDSDKEFQTASRIEHEEVEKHQTVLKILDVDQADMDQLPATETKPNK